MSFFINPQINLGRLVLSTSLLYILIGVAAGSVLLFIITKNNPDSGKTASDLITNFLLIIILTWKLFPILLAPGDIISSPVSIIYSSGGIQGIVLGVVFGIIYLVIKFFLFRKHPVGANGRSPLRGVLKYLIVFFATAIIVSSVLFFVSFWVRNANVADTGRGERPFARTVGSMAPGFELMNTDGDLISLVDYRGKWVILNFWATWCPPCRAELPTLIRFYDEADKDKIILLGINASETEKYPNGEDIRSYVSTFAEEKGINYPVPLDTKGIVSTVYGAGNLPTTVVISPDGVITKVKTGTADSFWLRSSTSGN